MKKVMLITYIGLFLCCGTQTYKYNSNGTMEQIKDNSLLNEIEGMYLNKIFETTRKDFDFIDKKVAFLTGSTGTKESCKESYLEMYVRHSSNANLPYDKGCLYIFNDTQKEESGGYDAAIVYWSKFAIPVEKVIKRLKKEYSN